MNKQKGFFITGTDTDIGKTIVSTILTLGFNGQYWKPIQSGKDPGTDSDFIRKYIDNKKVLKESYLLDAPLSPHASAKLEGKKIDFDQIEIPAYDENSVLIIEGAGGLLVPINDDYLMIDLMKKLNFPVILVARSSLGTINHTLLSLEAMRKRNLNIIGIVLVGEKNPSNKEAIEFYGKCKVIMEIPWLEQINKEILEKQFIKSWFKEIDNEDRNTENYC